MEPILTSQAQTIAKTDSFEATHSIKYQENENWLHSCWVGFVTRPQLISGSINCLENIQKYACPNLLIDHLGIRGTWPDLTDWRLNIWLPKALSSGLKKYAHVACPGSYSVMAAEQFYSRLEDQCEMMIFSELNEARNWLIS